jgi:hypothetical protein
VGPDERPEDQGQPTPADVGASADVPDVGASADVPAPAEVPAPGDGPAEAPRHRALKAFAVLGGAMAVALLLVGWNRVATTDGFCASCHDVAEAAASAERSVHSDVPCLSCHTGSGLAGVLRYTPTLMREALHTFTGWEVAHGVLEPRPCGSCHTDLASTPELAAAHGTDRTCLSCHGDVAHPQYRLAGFARPVEPVAAGESPHPRLFVQTHGDDVVREPDSCADCHGTDFCEACHFRETYPHPGDWITTHGPTQEQTGIQACEGCHPETFCAGCHGTEIPHNARWLAEHWRTLQDASPAPCMLCHPKTDCTECHARHEVHREQGLYT